jgi:hypothetical protein
MSSTTPVSATTKHPDGTPTAPASPPVGEPWAELARLLAEAYRFAPLFA